MTITYLKKSPKTSSTDDNKTNTFNPRSMREEEVKKYNFNFLLRHKSYTGNKIKQPELIGHILENMPDDDEDIGWAQVTTPLFNDFKNCLSTWNEVKESHDSLAVVREVKHVISENNIPVNFNFGYWHRVSQDISKLYEIAWSFFIIKRKIFNQCRYHIGYNPYKYISNFINIDIDTEEDFKESQKAYRILR